MIMVEPELLRIEEVQLINTNDDNEAEKAISRIDYEGQDLLETEEVTSHTDGDYVIRGFKAKVQFKNEVVSIAISTSNTMSYAKIENAGNHQLAQELIELLRERYLTHFRK